MALGARALFGSALFLAWACAHQTGSDLGGSASDNPAAGKGGSAAKGGTGGTSAKGGSGGSSASSTGGTSTSAGKGGTGTGGSSTGGSATGGSATGGSGNASASGGSGGTSGDSANGGQAGDDTIPPDVLANADVVLRYFTRAEGSKDDAAAIDTILYFENKSDDPLPLSQTKVRYWTTFEAEYTQLACYYAAIIGKANVTLEAVEDGADTHILIGFKDGSVPAHNASPFKNTEFQMKVDATGGTFDQTNDWSFDGAHEDGGGVPVANAKITVYLADKLIWGCEPSGKCAGDDNGAGGQGGQGGQAGETGTGGTGTGGSVSAGQGGEPNAGQGGA